MGIPVTFNGLSVTVPEDGDSGWGPDTTALLVELATSAAVVSSLTQNSRISTSTPTTILSSDFAVGIDVGSASVVNLPAGVSSIGQLFFVYDASGSARTHNITLTPNGSDTIGGSSSYVIRTDRGGVFVFYNTDTWVVVAENTDVLKTPRRSLQGTNASFVDASVGAVSPFPSVDDGESATVTLGSTHAFQFVVSLSTGEALLGFANTQTNLITAISDPSNIFLTSDAGTGVFLTIASDVITIKNRMGGARDIEFKSLTASVTSSTAWS